jgi:hypothetical protein
MAQVDACPILDITLGSRRQSTLMSRIRFDQNGNKSPAIVPIFLWCSGDGTFFLDLDLPQDLIDPRR